LADWKQIQEKLKLKKIKKTAQEVQHPQTTDSLKDGPHAEPNNL